MIVIRSAKLRRFLGTVLPFAAMPLLVFFVPVALQRRYYAPLILAMVMLALVLFVTGFERAEIGTRRLVLAAVMTSLSVVGRMIPLVKPVTALTIISALYLGKEAGFLVGALSAVLSNFLFGQGPWTPFQMLAWGMIGFFAGIASKPMRKYKLLLYFYAAISGLLYSLFMDVWTVVWTYGSFSLGAYLTAAGTALPFTVLYAVSNMLFLILLGKPIGDKLTRIQKKYGL